MERLEKLKSMYGYYRGNYKYITPGAEILKYVDQTVICVHFKQDEETKEWNSNYENAHIISIDDFDPMTMTYNCKYSLVNSENKTEEKEIRIIPEGFSWGNPEETGEMTRFVPMSIHFTMVEDEIFFSRLKKLYEEKDTIEIENLRNLSSSKEQEATLKYSCNIGAAIKLEEDGEILWVRLHKINVKHRNGTKYCIVFGDDQNTWSVLADTEDAEYEIRGLGMVKIIDLSK